MRILITGGFGFIGSALARRCLATGHDVMIIDALTYAANVNAVPRSSHLTVGFFDICDESAVKNAFKTFRPDWVFHLAAESHVDNSIRAAKSFFETNVMGTLSMIQTFREYFEQNLNAPPPHTLQFIHVSTDEVFGVTDPDGPGFSEQSPYAPRNPYAASKASSDFIAKSFAETYKLPITVTNCCNNYGPWQHPEKLIPKAIQNTFHGLQVPVYGDGRQKRQWIHVDDHVSALIAIIREQTLKDHRGFDQFVIAGDDSDLLENIALLNAIDLTIGGMLSFKDMASVKPMKINHVEDRLGHDVCYKVDASKLRKMGWRPGISFMKGLQQTIEWHRDNPKYWLKS